LWSVNGQSTSSCGQQLLNHIILSVIGSTILPPPFPLEAAIVLKSASQDLHNKNRASPAFTPP
jgi:hypothetical protein